MTIPENSRPVEDPQPNPRRVAGERAREWMQGVLHD